jgi:8-oxo-dGTP diphosphatase
MAKEGRDTNRFVAILVRNSVDNVLMGLRNDDFAWCSPGGHLKAGEDFASGAHRELKEETGLDALEMKLINIQKIGKMMIYLLEAKVDQNQEIDMSKDPDGEYSICEYVDPNDVRDNLHIPLENNVVLKHWMN